MAFDNFFMEDDYKFPTQQNSYEPDFYSGYNPVGPSSSSGGAGLADLFGGYSNNFDYQPDDFSSFGGGGGGQQSFTSSPMNYLQNLPSGSMGVDGAFMGGDVPEGQPGPQGQQNRRWLPNLSQNQTDAVKALTGLAGMFAQRQKQKDLMRAAQAQDPFGAQRPQYQSMLSQAYNNPSAYINSPEALAARNAAQRNLAMKLAASGSRNSGRASAELDRMGQETAYSQLANYRAGLAPLAGANIGPQGAAQLQSGAADAGLKSFSAPFAALGDIYGMNKNQGAPDYAALARKYVGGG
jgi:hypothetical protein